MEADELLIRRTLKDDQDAFRKIVEKYQTFVLAVCNSILKDYHEAENIAQETFIQAYNSLSQYQYKGFKTWISRIAVNKSIDYKRKMSTRTNNQMVYIDEVGSLDGNEFYDVEEKLLRKENNRRVITLCENLPEKYGKVLIKFYINSLSYQQISDEEGVSIRTVESRLYRAKKMFRERWEVEQHEAL